MSESWYTSDKFISLGIGAGLGLAVLAGFLLTSTNTTTFNVADDTDCSQFSDRLQTTSVGWEGDPKIGEPVTFYAEFNRPAECVQMVNDLGADFGNPERRALKNWKLVDEEVPRYETTETFNEPGSWSEYENYVYVMYDEPSDDGATGIPVYGLYVDATKPVINKVNVNDPGNPGDNIGVTASIEDKGLNYTYEWSNGKTGRSTAFNYDAAGTYTETVTVSNGYKETTQTFDIEVEELGFFGKIRLWIQNLF